MPQIERRTQPAALSGKRERWWKKSGSSKGGWLLLGPDKARETQCWCLSGKSCGLFVLRRAFLQEAVARRCLLGGHDISDLERGPLCNQSHQVRMAERHRFHAGYRMLGDPGMHLAAELDLPTKTGNGRELYERLALVVCDGVIQRVLYPTSGRAVTQILGWLTHER